MYAVAIQSSLIKERIKWLKEPISELKKLSQSYDPAARQHPKAIHYALHCGVYKPARAYAHADFDASATLLSALSNSCPSPLLFIEPINDLLNNKSWVMGP